MEGGDVRILHPSSYYDAPPCQRGQLKHVHTASICTVAIFSRVLLCVNQAFFKPEIRNQSLVFKAFARGFQFFVGVSVFLNTSFRLFFC